MAPRSRNKLESFSQKKYWMTRIACHLFLLSLQVEHRFIVNLNVLEHGSLSMPL